MEIKYAEVSYSRISKMADRLENILVCCLGVSFKIIILNSEYY